LEFSFDFFQSAKLKILKKAGLGSPQRGVFNLFEVFSINRAKT
jgi:hypothetical protein